MNHILKLILLLNLSFSFAQTNKEIASVYIKKSEINLAEQNLQMAEKNFDKAVSLLRGQIKDPYIDNLGTKIKYKLKNYLSAQKFSKHYFTIAQDKESKMYTDQLELFVEIGEKLDSIENANLILEQKELEHQQEIKRVKSLKNEWFKKTESLQIKASEIVDFDCNGITIYKNNGFYGILNDNAEVLLKATKYKAYRFFEGYILLLDLADTPSEILCFNTTTKKSHKLPSIASFNNLSTHYGVVTQPRGSDLLVTYPNLSNRVFVYNLKTKSTVEIEEKKPLLKSLKERKYISSYNKKGQVKIDKVWYFLDNKIGNNVHTLFHEDSTFYGYLFLSNNTVATVKEIGYLGAAYKNAIESFKNETTHWISTNQSPTPEPNYKLATYKGGVKIIKVNDYAYLFKKGEVTFNQEKTLESMKDYLKRNHVSDSYMNLK